VGNPQGEIDGEWWRRSSTPSLSIANLQPEKARNPHGCSINLILGDQETLRQIRQEKADKSNRRSCLVLVRLTGIAEICTKLAAFLGIGVRRL